MNMKRYSPFLLYILTLGATLLLNSCNLFIDEEDVIDENGFANVPIHSGMGYDHPITINDAGCTITYQYKSNVRQLSYEEQQRYIVNTKQDQAGAFIEIHYRLDTPADLLPVPGEILVSTVTERFPWGCNHLVQYRVTDEGVYKYIATFAHLEDTFEELDIDGKVSRTTEEEFYVEAEPLDDEENEAEQPEAEARSKVGVDFSIDRMDVHLGTDYISFRFPFEYSKKKEYKTGFYGEIGITADKNYYEIREELSFDQFSISNSNYKVQYKETIDESAGFVIRGGYSDKWRLHRWRPLQGKAVVVGPVVLVFFVNIDLWLSVDLEFSTSLTKRKTVEYTYDIDLYHLTIDKHVNVTNETGWKYDEFVGTLNVSMWVEVQLGIGIYGKILSVRLVPTVTATLEAQTPKIYKDSRGCIVFDITERAAPKLTFSFSVDLGVYIDISLRNILGNSMQVGTDGQKKLLEQLEADAKQTSEYYQAVVSADEASYDPNKKNYGKDDDNDKDENKDEDGDKDKFDAVTSGMDDVGKGEKGKKITFGPFIIGEPIEFPWFPVINDKSLRVIRSWDNESKTMTFMGEYSLKELGTMHELFGKQYIPALCLKKGKEIIDYFFPEEGNYYATLKTGITYHFPLPTIEDDQKYNISPCYFASAYDKGPVAIDKALNYNATSPNVILISVIPTKVTKYRNPNNFANEYRYKYTYNFSTINMVMGIENITRWGISEETNYVAKEYSKEKDKKLKDGTYKINWNYVEATDKEEHSFLIGLTPYFYVEKAKTVGNLITLIMRSDGSWETTDSGVEESGQLSRSAGSGRSKGQLVIETIEDSEGNIVWKKEGTS